MDEVQFRNIPLHKYSVDYLNEVFEQYTLEMDLSSDVIIDCPILHMYPESDTYDANGELNGYIDSLFFRAVVYDPINKIKYNSNRLHDAVKLNNISSHQTKIFKDGSTMIVFKQKAWFNPLAELDVYFAL